MKMILEGQFRERATVAIKIHCHRKNGCHSLETKLETISLAPAVSVCNLAQHRAF